MRLRRGTAIGKQDRMITRLGAGLIEGIRRTKKIALVAAIAVSSLLISCNSKDPAQPVQKAKPTVQQKDKGSKRPAPKSAFSDLDWERTHLMVFNGEVDDMHWENALAAMNAGKNNKAAGIHIAGLNKKKAGGAKRYAAGSLITSEKIEQMLEKVENESLDTVLVYLTGHKKTRTTFASRGGETLDHRFLPSRIRGYLGDRNVVLLTDSAPCGHFVNELSKNNGDSNLTMISPGKTNESAPCKRFMELFWYGMETGLDVDGDGKGSLKDSYLFASTGYRRINPKATSYYREPIRRIKEFKDIKGIKDGVLMASAKWCPPCRVMEPVFKAANLQITGSTRFYMIKRDDANKLGSLPRIFVFKPDEEDASRSGTMELERFIGWLKSKGVTEDKALNLKSLYKSKKYSTIALVAGWDGLSSELGNEKAFRLLIKLLRHEDRTIRLRAIEILNEGAKKADFSKFRL